MRGEEEEKRGGCRTEEEKGEGGREDEEKEKGKEPELTLLGLSGGDFRQVSVVVSLHLEVENPALWMGRVGDEEVVKQALG